jgi:hygromycin-B 4-O-kinase
MVAIATVTAFVQEHFAADAGEVERLAGGEFSRAYAFTTPAGAYVIRFNTAPHAAESFAKDEYAGRRFASAALPIPGVILRGPTSDGHFCISQRAAGRTIVAIPTAERRRLIPALFDTLDAIGRADVSASQGYGPWTGDGQGRYPSWRAYLAAALDDEPDGYYHNWQALYQESFLERDLYEAAYQHLLSLLERCPEQRGLIHNDYWFENILGSGEEITAVIDWGNALYGDPLYDVARLSWGADYPGWWYEDGAALVRDRYAGTPGYAERLACYQCHQVMDDLRFYAKTGRRDEYHWASQRLRARIAAAPTV